MDHTLAFYIVGMSAVLLTGVSKSGFGGGLGVMSVPFMSLFVTPQFAAAVMMPILLAMDVLIVWRYRKTWDGRIIGGLLPAAIVGLAVGSLVFQHMPADLVRLLIGLLAAYFVLQFLLSQSLKTTRGPEGVLTVACLGFLSGFASFIAHAGGPPVKGYLLRQELEKSWFVGTNTIFFFSLNFIKTIAYGAGGTLSFESLQTSALLAPMLLVGVGLGIRMHNWVDQSTFLKIVYTFLAFTACKLLYDSVPTVAALF